MKRVLVTGGTGFVGANLGRRLLREGHQVHLLVRPKCRDWRIAEIRSQFTLHDAAIEDNDAVERIMAEIRPEWIFHLAAYGAYSEQTGLEQMIMTNLRGTTVLVAAALKHGFGAFIHTGSSSEYGYKDHAPAETEWLEPNSHYAVTKAAATQFCRFTAQKTQTNIQTLRLYSIYGPFEEPTRFIPTVIARGSQYGDLPPLVNPNISRDFVFIDDAVDAYLAAALDPNPEWGAIYNVGNGTQTTIKDVAAITRRIFK